MLDTAGRHDIQVAVRAGAEPVVVRADPGQIEQVLMNLPQCAGRDARGRTLVIGRRMPSDGAVAGAPGLKPATT